MRGAQTLINLLDGSRDLGQVMAAAHELGISRQAAERVIGLLAAAGALHDFPAAAVRALPDGPRDRLARELATVSLAHGHTDGGALVLARRQAASVLVHGTGLVASGLASLLTASGVGRVSCTGPAAEPPATGPRLSSWPPTGRVRLGHPADAGHPAADRRTGTADRRAGSGRGTRGHACRPDLAVLIDGYQPELPGSLMARGVVHLTAAASEAIGVVGPLVIPGQTACLSCVDMARSDRDPAWPLILAQISGRAPQPAACAAVLAAAVAAQATAQALSFLDRAGPATAVINGTLELVLPAWQWRRHSWMPHRQCRCSRRRAS
jgi:bacteriocin biosynthesis cyclodehydratase domain-containing protein